MYVQVYVTLLQYVYMEHEVRSMDRREGERKGEEGEGGREGERKGEVGREGGRGRSRD